MKVFALLMLAAGFLMAGCNLQNIVGSRSTSDLHPSTSTPTEKTMVVTVKFTQIEWTKAFYKPGETAELDIAINAQMDHPFPAKLAAQISYLDQSTARLEKDLTLSTGDQSVSFTWQPPAESPRGYGVDLTLETQSGEVLAGASTAFDVLERWVQMPRYGFLTDFTPGRIDALETIAGLNSYHINALQFYDWMYRHDTFLTNQDPYQDPLGRTLSRKTVDSLIDAAHQYGMAAMPYTAIYAASLDFYKQHPDWAIFKADGEPLFFGENFLVYMDPRPGSPWAQHLLGQFKQILQQTGFDGIHLDSYGDPKVGYTEQGESYPIDTAVAGLTNLTKELVDAERPGGAVVFNCVNNYPIETMAPSKEDFSYIEVWPPYTWFTELHSLIVQAQKLGNGKPVVLAAYIDPQLEQNARLMDAIIFASGGGHIELGEHQDMLADAYFPRYSQMSPSLEEVIGNYYDFAVRYENLFGPVATDASLEFAGKVAVEGYSTSPGAGSNIIYPIARKTDGTTAISLVNLVGIGSPEWKNPIANPPTPLEKLAVRISAGGTPVKHVWMSSPDGASPALFEIPFNVEGTDITFELPSLQYWDLIVLK
ncbi:MAG: glycoside hydrolase family 66 protein [Chloroflexi bacterium]|nr:glycoside hydrolase family 66 protein [Chloroflexota bacterium]